MNVTGKAKVFAKEIEGSSGSFTAYSIGIGSKEQDGTWINAYLPARFRKGVEVPNNTTIDIKEAFLTVQKGNDYNRPMLMVMEFEAMPTGQQMGSGFRAVSEDDVPF